MTFLPLKTVLSGIWSQDVLDHVSPFILKLFKSSLKSLLLGESACEDIFEIYCLILHLSDELCIVLYDKKIIDRALNLSRKTLALYPVRVF